MVSEDEGNNPFKPDKRTPRTLDEALMMVYTMIPMCDLKHFGYAVVKDYLAQKFGAAMLNNPEAEEILKKLFEDITRRDL